VTGRPGERKTMSFTEEQIGRYDRQILLPDMGREGQERIRNGRVLCVGAGGLGSPVAYYLVAAGVGVLGLMEMDVVDISNLQRQLLHYTDDIGRPKVESAAEKLQALNPEVRLETYATRLTSENALEIIGRYDVVVDACDNFPTRYLVNDACVFLRKPLVHGSVLRFEGQVTTFVPGEGPCYRCVYPTPPAPGEIPSCQEAGVLGAVPGLVGSLQAVEALKLVAGAGESLVGRLVVYDALEMSFRDFVLRRDPDCAVCGDNPTIRELIDYEQFCSVAH